MTDSRISDVRGLLEDVERTRAAQQAARRGPAVALATAHQTYQTALETYASALEHNGWPLPPKMRVELHLQRSVCGVPRRSA